MNRLDLAMWRGDFALLCHAEAYALAEDDPQRAYLCDLADRALDDADADIIAEDRP